jgi:hypothetical protein
VSSGNINHQQLTNIKATDNAVFSFTLGRHSLLVHQFNQAVARNVADNKNINQKITRWATPKALRIFWLC